MNFTRGSHKQLQKRALHKRKASNALHRLSASTSTLKRTCATIEDIPDEQVGSISASSSMVSIDALVPKVRIILNNDNILCINIVTPKL